jgi:hypothetical protein
VDDTVDIDYFHCGQHCRGLEAGRSPIVFFFGQELWVEALPTLPKANGSSLAVGPNAVGSGC